MAPTKVEKFPAGSLVVVRPPAYRELPMDAVYAYISAEPDWDTYVPLSELIKRECKITHDSVGFVVKSKAAHSRVLVCFPEIRCSAWVLSADLKCFKNKLTFATL